MRATSTRRYGLLKYEVICYFGLALLGFAGLFQPRWRWPALAGLALLVATVSLSLPTNPDAFAFVDNVRYFTVFFGTGVLGYLVRKDLRINAIVLVPLFVLFVVSIRTPSCRGRCGTVPRLRGGSMRRR